MQEEQDGVRGQDRKRRGGIDAAAVGQADTAVAGAGPLCEPPLDGSDGPAEFDRDRVGERGRHAPRHRDARRERKDREQGEERLDVGMDVPGPELNRKSVPDLSAGQPSPPDVQRVRVLRLDGHGDL